MARRRLLNLSAWANAPTETVSEGLRRQTLLKSLIWPMMDRLDSGERTDNLYYKIMITISLNEGQANG